MAASFHPKEDLVVSASLDQSVRVWDISGLRKKHSAPQAMSFEDQMARANQNQADMFGNTDAVVKFVLEGHDRGVNFVAFHPTLPLIVSAGDDRLSFKRENDRFWTIAAHPEINLFAAGHDNGVMVFKLERERPASAVYQNNLFYINKEKHVRSYDFQKNIEAPSMLSLKKLGSAWVPPRTLSYNPAERSILVTSPADGGTYELINLPRDASGAVEPTDTKRGSGNSAVFVARNRFAVFNQSNQQIDIKDLSNSTTKTIKPPTGTTDIYFGGTGNLLLITPTTVVLYDIQAKKNLAELSINGVKYVVWSSDGLHVALLSKHNVTIATKSLEQVSTLHETIRIKSAVFDDTGVLLYSTLNHIKYSLMNGDNGIVRTLEQTVYLVRVKGRNVYCLDRAAKPKILQIDPTEYRFKLALVKRNYDEMLNIIKTSSLVGQSIISYLQKKGYPEIALQFVQDPQTRFELAIECGNLEVAVEMAKQLDRPKLWQRLSTEALAHGNHQTVEMTYQKLRNFDKLSFLYLTTGDQDKLKRMAKIAEHRGDMTARFQNALYLGDVQNRIEMFQELDLYPLAYATAKAHGLDEQAQSILEAAGVSEEQINLPSIGSPLAPPKPIVPTHKANWPTRAASSTVFEKALQGEVEGVGSEEPAANGYGDEDLMGEPEANHAVADLGGDEEDDVGGWDMGDDGDVEAEDDFVEVEGAEAGAGSSEADLWARNSPLAADHVAAGSFDTAMQLLNRQVGAVNFAPLEERFQEIYQATRTFLPATPNMPSLVNYVRRTVDETDSRKILPIIPRDLESILATDLAAGKQWLLKNKLEDGVAALKKLLQLLMVNVVSSQAELSDAKKAINTATQYILAMSIELERRKLLNGATDISGLSDADKKRALELSAYFTVPELEGPHNSIPLSAAMTFAQKNKQLNTALNFANALLDRTGNAKMKEQAKRVKTIAERNPSDVIEIDFDQFADFDICAASYTPIYSGMPSVTSPYSGAKYHARYKGTVCRIDGITQIGAPASGLRLVG
ncbi:coatomer subunit alpha [Pyrenophora tritici-repentis Pt-1C-BFP]|uniref:Coatomer subunit alpha n=1 Tax=Pyrenophora tritici-repentis (strain Pt-1C-BFP) TaxID=426418 RepID=B2VTV5_PYRTR|nr:coatomer subunit alpha [Pyrenophora tritici-repentis Pt-1C-BFP]EDU41438.1 coatomer subunit alpha [Pyrenophora tritici-repentis Pt-1C-BFP]